MRYLFSILFMALLFCSCSGSRKGLSDNLTVVSFNIRNSSAWGEDGDNDWAHRRAAVADMILQLQPDLLGMQEMLPDQLHYLDSALAGQYRRIGVGRDDGDTLGENMCIYYRPDRVKLMHWSTQWLSPTPDSVSFGWDAACRRTVTIGCFRDLAAKRNFVYLNTHLDHMGPLARRNSVLQLCSIARQYSCPVLIGGDMNSDITDSIFLPLRDNNLYAVRDSAAVSDSAITYNSYGKGGSSMIDHFFARGFLPLEFRTLNGDYGVPYISDHYPVLAKLQLGNN